MAEYFRLTQDRRIPRAPVMTRLPRLTHYRDALRGDFEAVQKRVVFPVEPMPNIFYPAVLDRQLYVVNREVLTVLQMFHPKLKHTKISLMDHLQESYRVYFAPHFPKVACLSAKSDCNMDGSVVRKVVLERGRLPEQLLRPECFRVADVRDQVVVVSLGVAESLLRRRIKGIRLLPVSIED